MRVLREILAGFARHRVLVAADQIDPVVAGKVGVERIALAVLEGIENVLEVRMLEAEHHVRIHRDEAAVAIMPGIEARPPERTETSSGFLGSPKALPVSLPTWSSAFSTCAFNAPG